MKKEWLVTDVTAVEYPARAEHAILERFWASFGQCRPVLWSRAHFVMHESPLSSNSLT